MVTLFFISSFFIILVITLTYYYFVEKPKLTEKKKSNVIQLQTDGFDFILYQGKITEMNNDYHRYFGNMDVTVYSKSLFVGFLEPKQTYLYLPARAIQSVKYEPNKVTLFCYKETAGTKKIILKGKSTKNMYHMAKKIDFISRRSRKVNAI